MRISSIEAMRTLALLAVVVIHSSPFANPFDPTLWPEPHQIYLAALFNQLSRFAVPFFFLTAGFFFEPKIKGPNAGAALWRYCRPLLILWVSWSLVYILVPFNPLAVASQGYLATMAPQWNWLLSDTNNLWVGGMVHLWYLPALILAMCLCLLAEKLGQLELTLILGLLLYLLALLGGSYGKPILGEEWQLMTRNGPFFSLIFVSLGMLIRRYQWRIPRKSAFWLMVAGGLLYLLEGATLYFLDGIPFGRHDFLLASLPWCLGLFLWLLATPDWGKGTLLVTLAPKVLGLYCLHMLLVIWLMPLSAAWLSPLWEVCKPLVLLALSVLLYQLLTWLPLSSWLLQGRPATPAPTLCAEKAQPAN